MRWTATLVAALSAWMSITEASAYTFGDWASDNGYAQGDTMPKFVQPVASGINSLGGIERFDWDTTPTEELLLWGNELTSIEMGDLSRPTNLSLLDLGNNRISSIESGDFEGLASLRHLELYNNEISSIESGDFEGLANLRFLTLWGNKISSIESGDFEGLDKLMTLQLQRNAITSVEPGDFAGLNDLTSLRLDENAVTSIEDGAFAGLANLELLSLDRNAITVLNFTGATFEKLGPCSFLGGLCLDRDQITTLILDEAVLNLGSFNGIVNETISVTDASVVNLTFSDESPADLGNLINIETLSHLTVDFDNCSRNIIGR